MAPRKKWSENDLLKLLELYENYELLWNPKDEDYNDAKMRKSALKGICDVLQLPGISVVEMKAKIKSLRSTYTQELAKICKSKRLCVNEDDVYKPKLVWFELADSFLRRVTIPRNKQNIDNEHDNEAVFLEDDSEELNQNYTENFKDEVDQCTTVAISRPIPTQITAKPVLSITPAKKRNKQQHLPQISSASKDHSRRTETGKNEIHEFDIFGTYVASCLKKLPLLQALQLQEKLNTAINQERMAFLLQSPTSQSASSFSSDNEKD